MSFSHLFPSFFSHLILLFFSFSPHFSKFKSAWFLQALEALANVIIGGIGLLITGGTAGLPQELFALSGATQVCAKAFTSMALASGV